VLTIQQEGLGSQTGEGLGGKAKMTSKLLLRSAATGRSAVRSDQLQQDHHDPGSKIWTWEFRVVRCNLRVHMVKPSGVHIRH